jgi:hypothetical protein
MKWQGFKRIGFSSVAMNVAEIRRRSKAAHVVDLAGDIKAHGEEPIQAPTVRAKTKQLVCGRDRMAALLVLRAKTVWVHVVDCTDDEAKELEIAENAYRRAENRAELIAELMRLKEQHLRATAQVTQRNESNTVTGRRGSHDPIKTEARKQVARATGITPAAVRQAEVRAAKKVSSPAGHGAAGDPPTGAPPLKHPAGHGSTSEAERALTLPAGFRDFGLEVPKSERAALLVLVDELGEHEQWTKNLLGWLTRGERDPLRRIAGAVADRIREAAHGLGHALREAIPVGRCFYCKGRADLVPTCTACGQTGFVGRHGGDGVPAELKAAAPLLVAIDGRSVPYAGGPAATKGTVPMRRSWA